MHGRERQDVRVDQPEGNRPPVSGNARAGEHNRAATRKAQKYGTLDPRLWRQRRELRGRSGHRRSRIRRIGTTQNIY